MPTDDRAVLEQQIFRELFLGRRFQHVLFVGCSLFTSWYPELFEGSGISFETVDPDPAAAPFGAPGKHHLSTFEALGQACDLHGTYDLVVLNGVFGYGIDSPRSKAAALEAAHSLLRPGGNLLIGYRASASPDFDPAQVDERWFGPTDIPGLGRPSHLTRSTNSHAFFCLAKRSGAAD